MFPTGRQGTNGDLGKFSVQLGQKSVKPTLSHEKKSNVVEN